ncbi:MAG: PAS domain S-box protein [Anaerolineae bacterium]|nr:PAS domain S-box protein [Anaerolineae bacterium]
MVLGREFLPEIVDVMRDMVLIADSQDFRIVYANQSAQTTAGCSLDDLAQMTLPDLFVGERRDVVVHHLEAVTHTGDIRFTCSLVQPDGSTLPVDVRVSLAVLGGNSRLVCVARDLGDRRRQPATDAHSQPHLQESQKRFQSLVEAIPDLLFRIRRDGTYLDYKPADVPLYASPDAFLGKTVNDVMPVEVASQTMAVIDHVLTTGQTENLEYHLMIDNERNEYEARIVAMDQDEVLVVVRDITDLYRATVALRESEERYRGLIESQQGLIVRVTPDGCFTFVNEAYCKFYGKTREQLLGSPFMPLVFPDDLPDIQKTREKLEVPPYRSYVEMRSITAQGCRWLAWEGHAIRDDDGRIIEIQASGRDITERKRVEDEFQKQTLLLEGVTRATNCLLALGRQETAIGEALAILGEAVGVDYIYVFENHNYPDIAEQAVSARFEWGRVLSLRGRGVMNINSILWQDTGLQRWFEILSGGGVVSSLFEDLPPGEQAVLADYDTLSVLVVPIFISGTYWGYIGFNDCCHERQWRSDEINALQTMAASVGAAIERQRAEDKLRREREIADTLREVGTVLTSTLDRREVLEQVLEQVRRVVPYDAANIALVEDNQARIVHNFGYEAFGTTREQINQVTFALDEIPLFQRIFETKKPYVCADTRAEPAWIRRPESAWVVSWIGTPIVARGEVIGFFSLDSARSGAYKPEHADMLTPFAHQAAVALENSRLYQEIQRQAGELANRVSQLQTLYDAGQALQSSLELDEILCRFADKMTNVSHATSTIICDYDANTQTGTVRAAYYRSDIPIHEVRLDRGQRIDLDTPVLQRTITSQEPLLLTLDELGGVFHDTAFIEAVHTAIIVPSFSKGRLTLFAVIRDSSPNGTHISDRVKMCQALANQAAIALEQATLFADIQELERIKSEMIRMASHDLRNPLARTRGFVEMLEKRIDPALGREQQQYITVIRHALDEIEQIVTDILSLERIEARHRVAEPVLWCDVISHTIQQMLVEAEAKNQTVSVECSPDLPAIRGDPVRLQQALANLFGNAIKYTPAGGVITVRALVKDYGSRPNVVIEVEDNGIGIPLDQQHELFDLFYRAQQDKDRHIPGWGVGLSVVKAAVEYHQGSVYVDSEPGRGSLFGFRIPV